MSPKQDQPHEDYCPAEGRLSRMETEITYIKQSVSRVERLLSGNDKPGIVIRIDRMEQWLTWTRRLLKSIIAILIPIIVAVISLLSPVVYKWIRHILN
jgi:hypothetical protein